MQMSGQIDRQYIQMRLQLLKESATETGEVLTAIYSRIIMVSVGCKQAPQNCTMFRSKLTLRSILISYKAARYSVG